MMKLCFAFGLCLMTVMGFERRLRRWYAIDENDLTLWRRLWKRRRMGGGVSGGSKGHRVDER